MSEVAWITVVDEREAEGDLADVYAQVVDSNTGRAAHIMKIHSLNPKSMIDHRTLYRTLMFGPSPLKRAQREMIGVVVSGINGCHY